MCSPQRNYWGSYRSDIDQLIAGYNLPLGVAFASIP